MNSEAKNNLLPNFQRVDAGKVRRTLLVVAAYLAVFLTLDWLSRTFQVFPGVVAWYPPDGLSFAFLLTFGAAFAPVVALGSLASSLFIYHFPASPAALIAWAITIPTVYLLAAWALHRGAHLGVECRRRSNLPPHFNGGLARRSGYW